MGFFACRTAGGCPKEANNQTHTEYVTNSHPGQGPTERTEHRPAFRSRHPRCREQAQTHLPRGRVSAGSPLPARRRHPAGRLDGGRRPGHRGAERGRREGFPRRADHGPRVRRLPPLAGRTQNDRLRRPRRSSAAGASPPPTPTSSPATSPRRGSRPRSTPSKAPWRSPRR